jgi:hypothetical protein
LLSAGKDSFIWDIYKSGLGDLEEGKDHETN